MFKRLLVPVGLSAQSMLMVGIASHMKHYGVKDIVVYSAVDTWSKKDSMMELLDQKLSKAKMKHEMVVEVSGDPAQSIVKAATTHHASIIAMAVSGKGRVQEFIVGSTSLAVIRKSKVPILLDKFPLAADEDPEGYFKNCPPLLDRVLVTLHLSKVSKQTLPFGQQLIDAGAKNMTLFHVVQASKYSMTDDKRFQEVKHRIEAYRDKPRLGDCKVDVHIHFGTTTYNILEAAREVDATIIVLGTTEKATCAV